MNFRERFEKDTGLIYPTFKSEALKYLESELTPIPGPPPKDGKEYVAYCGDHPVPQSDFTKWSIVKWRLNCWTWDADAFEGYEPTAHLAFSLDDITEG